MSQVTSSLSRVGSQVRWIALAIFAAYHLTSFLQNQIRGGILPRAEGRITVPAKWRMFTTTWRTNFQMYFEGEYPTGWRRLPMERWYSTKFLEGRYRWERPNVERSRSVQAAFLAAACKRAHVPRTRMVHERWRKVRGARPEDRPHLKRKILQVWQCGRPAPMPPGLVL